MDISLEEFKSIVIDDFQNAFRGAEILRQATAESDCRHITHDCDIAQVALAKFFRKNDIHVSAGIDLTFRLALQQTNATQFFDEFYSSNQHIDASACTEFLPVAVGAAMAEKMYRNNRQLQCNTTDDNIILCTLSGDTLADGDFLESVYFAATQQLPLAIVLWNNTGEHTNGSYLKLLSGFAAMRKNGTSLSIQAVKGSDYSALCHTFEQQTALARSGEMTTLTFVEGCTDSIVPFAQWIVSKQIASAEQIRDIKQQTHRDVERDRKDAYYKSLVNGAPVRQTLRSINDIADLARSAHPNAVFISNMPNAVNKAIGLAQCGLRPIVDTRCNAVAASLIAEHNDLPIVMRMTDMNFGSLLYALPSTVIAMPCCKAQADELYRTVIAQGIQCIVIEQVGTQQVGRFATFAIGEVHVETEGSDATILCYGATVEPATDAAAMLRQSNISAEVIDLCTLRPFDVGNVVTASIAKTHRLFIVDSDRTQAAARYVIAELSLRSDAMKQLLHTAQIIVPQGNKKIIEAVDIFRAVEAGR